MRRVGVDGLKRFQLEADSTVYAGVRFYWPAPSSVAGVRRKDSVLIAILLMKPSKYV